MQEARPSLAFILIHLAGTGLFWGSGFIFIKLTGGEIPPLTLAAWRGVLAGLALAAFVMLLRQSPLPARHELAPWVILGFINGFLPNLFVAYAMLSLPAGPGAMIQAGSPLITAILAHFAFSDEPLTLRRAAGIALGFSGVGLLVGESAFEGAGSMLAALAMLATATLYAIGNIYIRTVKGVAPLRLALGQQVFSGIFACLFVIAIFGPPGFHAPAGQIPLLAALGIIATALPIAFFMRLISAAGPVTASMAGYLVPACAVVLAAVFLGERLGPRQLFAGAVILAGVYIVSSARKAAKA